MEIAATDMGVRTLARFSYVVIAIAIKELSDVHLDGINLGPPFQEIGRLGKVLNWDHLQASNHGGFGGMVGGNEHACLAFGSRGDKTLRYSQTICGKTFSGFTPKSLMAFSTICLSTCPFSASA